MSDPATWQPPDPSPRDFREPFRVLVQAGRRWIDDDCGQRAAAIAYYALMSFFPFIILLASVSSILVGDDAEDIRRALAPLRPLLPDLRAGFWDRVQELVDKRGVLSLASLGLLVVLATRVTVAVQRALRPIFREAEHVPRKRLRWSRWYLAHGMTVAALVAIGLMLTSVALLEVFVRSERSPHWLNEAVASSLFTRHALPLVVLALLSYALFVFLPDVEIRRRYRLIGAVFFAAAHDLAMSAWARITGWLAPSDLLYGSFVGAVSFAAWTWIAASILLLSATLVAELNATREKQSKSGPRPGRERRAAARPGRRA